MIIYSKTINTTYKKMQNSQFTLLAGTTGKVEESLHDFKSAAAPAPKKLINRGIT
jgi:hypothetical protein